MTLQKIADAAGVARSTVSRALKNHPRIGQKTRDRIQRLSREMGYHPDAELTNVMTRLRKRNAKFDSPVVAFLLWQYTSFDSAMRTSPNSLYHGLWERSVEAGYRPEFFNLAEFDGNRKRITQILRSRGIRGGILCPAERPAPLPMIPWDELSVVAIGYSVSSLHLHRCVANHYQGMLDCIERLQSAGYRRIGAVFSPAVDVRSYGFYHAAYLLSATTMDRARLLPLLVCPTGGEANFNTWFDVNKPDAIIYGGLGPFIPKWLKNRGISVPGDVGLANLQVERLGEESGIWQNAYHIGAGAIDLLSSLMDRHEKGLPNVARTTAITGEWVDGATTFHVGQTTTIH